LEQQQPSSQFNSSEFEMKLAEAIKLFEEAIGTDGSEQLRQLVQQLRDDRCCEQPPVVAIVGEQGIGKSFLLNLLLMLTTVDDETYCSPEFEAMRREWRKRYKKHFEAERDAKVLKIK
jgi:predicted GTPase